MYEDLLPDVRTFEEFTYQLVGMLTDLKRKLLPAIAKAVDTDPQMLHLLLANALWAVTALRNRRLALLHRAIGDRPFTRSIDEAFIDLGHTPSAAQQRTAAMRAKVAKQAAALRLCLVDILPGSV